MTSPDSTAADLLDATNPAVHAPAAITTPWLDAVCTGGLSIVVIAGLLIYDLEITESVPVTGVIQISIGGLVLMQTLINSPHFIASYRLLYRKRQNLKQHQFVSIYLPIIMLTVIVACIWQSVQWPNSIPIMLPLEQLLAPLLLAWHYTGQAWGMTSCFAFLGGLKMTLSERTVIRCGLRALIAYHVLLWWNLANSALYLGLSPESAGDLMAALLTIARVVVFATFAVGLTGLRRLSQREQKPIPLRCWMPWLATFVWYVFVDLHRGPYAFVLLQIFHALQYLIFPLRVELNQHHVQRRRTRTHVLLYYLVLVGVGFLAFNVPGIIESALVSPLNIAVYISIAINVHHYFIDSVIWKIRNPEVREALFAHLEPSNQQS